MLRQERECDVVAHGDLQAAHVERDLVVVVVDTSQHMKSMEGEMLLGMWRWWEKKGVIVIGDAFKVWIVWSDGGGQRGPHASSCRVCCLRCL